MPWGITSVLQEVTSVQLLGSNAADGQPSLFVIGCLMALLLIVSGYFYGRFFQKNIRSLQKLDATLFGVLFLIGFFEVTVIIGILNGTSITPAYYYFLCLLAGGPLLCLFFQVNVKPECCHLVSLLLGLCLLLLFRHVTAGWNTADIYLDAPEYLSRVINAAHADSFYLFDPYTNKVSSELVVTNDLQGYYWFWGMVLRLAESLFGLQGQSLTPIYIWGGSFLYEMMLVILTWDSVRLFFEKKRGLALVLCALLISPFFTNYYNTLEAYFGNTMRTLCAGSGMLTAYLLIEKKDRRLFYLLFLEAYAGLALSSFSLVLFAALFTGVFYYLADQPDTAWKDYTACLLAAFPVLRFGLVVLLNGRAGLWLLSLSAAAGIEALGIGLIYLLRHHLSGFQRFLKVLLAAVFVLMVVVSYQLRDSQFGYAFYFSKPGTFDMTMNYTSSLESLSVPERIRNLTLYAFCLLLFVNFKDHKAYKKFLLLIGILFLDPLTMPFLAHTITDRVYHRLFDLLINPFVLIFLIENVHQLFSRLHPYFSRIVLTTLAAGGVIWFTWPNLTVPFISSMSDNPYNFNWEYKVSDSTYDLYSYIIQNIPRAQEDRPVFLSQDVDLLGYVDNASMSYSPWLYRNVIGNHDLFEEHELLFTLLNPTKYTQFDEILDGDYRARESDYSRLPELLEKYPADYVIIRNTIDYWVEETDTYEKCYVPLLEAGLCSVVYENEEWVLLKTN